MPICATLAYHIVLTLPLPALPDQFLPVPPLIPALPMLLCASAMGDCGAPGCPTPRRGRGWAAPAPTTASCTRRESEEGTWLLQLLAGGLVVERLMPGENRRGDLAAAAARQLLAGGPDVERFPRLMSGGNRRRAMAAAAARRPARREAADARRESEWGAGCCGCSPAPLGASSL